MIYVRDLLVCFSIVFCLNSLGEDSLTVVNFGGSYAKACQEGFEHDFSKETGVRIDNEVYNGGLAQMRAQVESNSVFWDVIYIEGKDVLMACDEGIIEPIDDMEFPPAPDGTPWEEDFLPNVNLDCGIAQVLYATYIAYDPRQFEGRQEPSKLEHFFDLENFPGRRGVSRRAEVVLEMALMADGVATEDVYDVLSQESGVARAFAKLDTIKDSIVWWEAGAQPPQMLADGEVSMTIAWNGRIFNAQVLEKQPFKDIWDGQVLDIGYIAVLAGSPNKDTAIDFIKYGSSTKGMAGVANRIAYSPTRRSALALVDKHIPTGVPMHDYMPNRPDQPGRKLWMDNEFWADNLDDLYERLSAWLSN